MLRLLATLLIVCSVGNSFAGPAAAVEDNLVSNHRTPRFGIIKALLPYINLKIKTPFECKTGKSFNGNPITGTCMSSKDCTNAKGTVDGQCADGYGSCCVFEAACGATVERNRTYLINNGSFTNGQFSCQYTIKKPSDTSTRSQLFGACQVRLDFEEFTLGQPDQTTSLCSNDSFEIGANSAAFGKICGSNSGQHIYLPIGSSDSVATITLTGAATTSVSRKWRIKTTYIPCLSNMTAPPGCLQYYDSVTGNFQSFNFQSGSSTAVSQIGGLRYSICVGETAGSCGITYNPMSATSFSLSQDASAATTAAQVGTQCTTDYLAILQENAAGVVNDNNKFCGTKLDPLTTYSRPFVVRVRTDETETTPDNQNKGFSLSYQRQGCSTTTTG